MALRIFSGLQAGDYKRNRRSTTKALQSRMGTKRGWESIYTFTADLLGPRTAVMLHLESHVREA
jgi:hypothetical protein